MADIDREKKRSENADGMVWKYDSSIIVNCHTLYHIIVVVRDIQILILRYVFRMLKMMMITMLFLKYVGIILKKP